MGTARAFQYAARMLFGLTGRDFFGNLLRALALSRKTLRFYKPVKALKRIEDISRDPALDLVERRLTVMEVGSDAIYATIDHVAFLQRIGGMPWMSERQVDMLDRFLEFFWLTEVLPVIWREIRKLLRLRANSAAMDAKPIQDAVTAEAKRKAIITLVKAAACDLPCAFYFLQPYAIKQRRVHKTWCGLLGFLASLISIHQNWPRESCEGK